MQSSLCRVHQTFQEEERIEPQGGEEDMSQPQGEEDATLLRLSEQEESRLRLEDLSLEQREGFWKAVAEGSLEVQPWEPWWKPQQVSNAKEQRATSPVAPLTDLTAQRPSPLVAFSVQELVLSYCYVLILYNGDAECDIVESVALLRDLAPSLSSVPLSSTEQVVNRMVARVCELESSHAPTTICHCLAVAQEAALVLGSSDHLARALRHSKSLLDRCASKHSGPSRKSIKLAARKVEFFLSWATAENHNAQERAKELRSASTERMSALEKT
jgi:hypothetical protein